MAFIFFYKSLNLGLAHFRTYVHLTEKTRNQNKNKPDKTQQSKNKTEVYFNLSFYKKQ